MKKIFITFGLTFCVNLLFAQNFKDVKRPSPEALAFSKYTDIPISNYTGVPNVEIPIYSIKTGDLTVPVTLGYHSGGIRVDEEASRVGLGWILNAEGLISRTVNGGDDFKATTGYLNNSMPEYFNSETTSILQTSSSNLLFPQNSSTVIYSVAGHSVDMDPYLPGPGDSEDHYIDLEPDVFNYNFNGYSGKFSIRKNKEIVKQSPDALVIKLLNNDGTSWQIITPDGVSYTFDKTEKVRYQSSGGSFTEYISSWYLSSIKTPAGAQISYSYLDNGSYTVKSYNNLNEKYIMGVYPLNGGASAENLKPVAGTKTTSYPSLKTYNLLLLNSITFPTGSVSFEYQNRIDLAGDKRLSKITVLDKAGSNRTSYEFVQDYFTANAGGNTIPDPELNIDQNFFNKRLKLISLIRRGASQDVDHKYQFEYEEGDLPSKKSFARDGWGYYNGQILNTSFLPNTSFVDPFVSGQTVSYTSGGNRLPSSSHVKAFLLKKITYPTGGTSSFDYESNDYDIANSRNNLSAGGNPENVTETKSFFTRRYADDTFTIKIPQIIPNSNITLNFRSQNGQAQTWPYAASDDAFLEIYSDQNLVTPVKRILLGLESFWVNEGNFTYKRDDAVVLPAGNYIVKTHVAGNVVFLNYIDFYFKYTYIKDQSTDHSIEIGGGVRISKISNYDPASNKTTFKSYNYHYNYDYNGDGIAEECSYGRRLSDLRYTNYEIAKVCSSTSTSIGVSQTFNLYSQSNIASDNVVVGYDKVTVSENDGMLNGYSQYSYKNSHDIETPYNHVDYDSFAHFGFRPIGIPNLRLLDNGLLIKQIDFKFNPASGLFSKIKETTNTYQSLPTISQVGIRVTRNDIGPCLVIAKSGLLLAQYPAFQSALNRLSSQVVEDYSDNNQTILTKTEYEYENSPKHYLPVTTTITSSNDKKVASINIYPTDFASGNAAIDDMKVANIIAPIEQVTFIKDGSNVKIKSGKISLYKPGGKGLLDKEYFLEAVGSVPLSAFKFSNQTTGTFPSMDPGGIFGMDAAYKLRMSYNKYDLIGNLLEQEKTQGIKYSYLWGYNSQYPIAEIKNADYSSVEAILGGASAVATFSAKPIPTLVEISNFLSGVRSALPNAQITTYTYDPLAGITSQTDAKGQTTSYEYDSSLRLKNVKDQNGNILKNTTYNYKP